MRLTRRPFLILAASAALVVGWSTFRAAEREIAVLRTFDVAGQDFFATVWVVDDPHGFTWIRAHRPDRKWLAAVRERPDVELQRDGHSRRYVARIFEDGAARSAAARLFREKYGLADRLREWTSGHDPVPVRLETR